MPIKIDYPSPTSMGVGKLSIRNGEETVPDTVRFHDHRPAPAPAPAANDRRHIAVGVPKVPSLSVSNGGTYAHTILKESPDRFQS